MSVSMWLSSNSIANGGSNLPFPHELSRLGIILKDRFISIRRQQLSQASP